MNINIYEKYRVIISSEYTTLSEENETKYDNIFVKNEYHNEEIIPGGKLMEMIAKELDSNDISEFQMAYGCVFFEYFNPNNGEGGSKKFIIEVMENDKDTQ